jgi:AbrB family looped-hinge helix DNA binding protein
MTTKRQVTFPRKVVERLGLKEGDSLQISETPDGILIRPHRFDPKKLAPLRGKIRSDLPAPDLEDVRHAYALNPRLRD